MVQIILHPHNLKFKVNFLTQLLYFHLSILDVFYSKNLVITSIFSTLASTSISIMLSILSFFSSIMASISLYSRFSISVYGS